VCPQGFVDFAQQVSQHEDNKKLSDVGKRYCPNNLRIGTKKIQSLLWVDKQRCVNRQEFD
jgi:hypothetical protein